MRALAIFFCMAALVPNAFGQDRSSSSSSKSDSLYLCTADARWANTNGQLSYSKQIQVPVSMTLLTAISKANECAKNGEIRVNATFLTESQDYICSGTIVTDPKASDAYNTDVESWGERGWLAVGRICRWAKANGATALDCPVPK